VIMLVNLDEAAKEQQFNHQWHIGIAASLVLGGLFLFVLMKGHAIFPANAVRMDEPTNTQQVGLMLFQNYLLPFEIASLLLLVAIVGAVVMAKKRI
jgi:NADH-quinone oxidoreductase subunit J